MFPDNLLTYVGKTQYVTEHPKIHQLSFKTRLFRKNDKLIIELLFDDEGTCDTVDGFIRRNFIGLAAEEGYLKRRVQFTPKLKLVGLPYELEEDRVIHDILARSPWISNNDISLLRTYRINNMNRISVNANLNVHSVEVFRRLIAAKHIMVHRQKCPVYEYI